MARQNKLRFQKSQMYRLSRDYGVQVNLYKFIGQVINLQTGKTDLSYEIFPISRAIVMTRKELRKFEYDLAFIAANKNFTYGGYYDVGTRFFILERRLLKTYSVSMNDHFIYQNKKYNFKQVLTEESSWIYAIEATVLDGQQPNEIQQTKTVSSINLGGNTDAG